MPNTQLNQQTQDTDHLLQMVKSKLKESKYHHQIYTVPETRILSIIKSVCQLGSYNLDNVYEENQKIVLMFNGYVIYLNEFLSMMTADKANILASKINGYYSKLYYLLQLQANHEAILHDKADMREIMNNSHEFLIESQVLMPKEHEILSLNYLQIKNIYHGVEDRLMQIHERAKSVQHMGLIATMMKIILEQYNSNESIADYIKATDILIKNIDQAMESYQSLKMNQVYSQELIQNHENHLVNDLISSVC